MTTENLQLLPDAGNAGILDAVSAYATDRLFDWLTAPGQEQRAREFVRDGAALVGRRGVRLLPGPGEAAPTVAETVLGVTALRLSRSFGEDAPDGLYDLGTWAGACALGLSAMIDWQQLADRLLRRYVLAYASDATGAG